MAEGSSPTRARLVKLPQQKVEEIWGFNGFLPRYLSLEELLAKELEIMGITAAVSSR